MSGVDWRETKRFVRRASRSFLGGREFSVPLIVSLVCGAGVGFGVLGNLRVDSLNPPRVSGIMEPRLVEEAGYGLEWGAFHQSADAVQEMGVDRLLLLLVVVALMALAIVGVNLSLLLLRRWAAVAHEQAVHAAVGATTGQIVSRRLTGAVVALILGGGGGLLVGFGMKVFVAASWPHDLTAPATHLAWSIAGPVLGLSVLLLLAVAVFPHLPSAGNGRLGRALAGGSRVVGGRYPEGVRVFLPSLQIGLSITLLMGAAALLQGGIAGGGGGVPVDFGGETFRIPVEPVGGAGGEGVGVVGGSPVPAPDWAGLLSGMEARPEVLEAAFFSPGAWQGVGPTDLAWTECGACFIGGLWVPFKAPLVQHHVVSPDSFLAMGVTVTRGREFNDQDGPDAPLVAVVNEAYARDHFDVDGPLGRSLGLGKGQSSWHAVIGVVENMGVAGIGSTLTPEPTVYLSSLQHPPTRGDVFVRVRGSADGEGEGVGGAPEGNPLPDALRGWAGEVEEMGFEVEETVAPLSESLEEAVAPLRWFGRVALALGLLTMAIAAFGLYSILDYSVSLRQGELGVRRALGAKHAAVVRLVLGRSARIFLLGAFLGLEGGLYLTSRLEEIAFQGQLFDWRLFLLVSGVLAFAALLGTLRPARHAMKVPPRTAMGGM